MKFFLNYWLPLIVWMGIIALGSSDLMSSAHTSRFLVPFLRWLNPDISMETLAQIHFVVRKFAHLFEYAVLGLLMARAFRGGMSRNTNRITWYAMAWAGSTIFAGLDEWHQSFLATRGGAFQDVLIDSFGALLGVLVCVRWKTRRPKVGPVRAE